MYLKNNTRFVKYTYCWISQAIAAPELQAFVLVWVTVYFPLTQAYEPGGMEGLQPPDSGKAIIFRAKGKFFGQKAAAKNEKNVYLLNEKRNSFCLAR